MATNFGIMMSGIKNAKFSSCVRFYIYIYIQGCYIQLFCLHMLVSKMVSWIFPSNFQSQRLEDHIKN